MAKMAPAIGPALSAPTLFPGKDWSTLFNKVCHPFLEVFASQAR
jgi:hypothetical protein